MQRNSGLASNNTFASSNAGHGSDSNPTGDNPTNSYPTDSSPTNSYPTGSNLTDSHASTHDAYVTSQPPLQASTQSPQPSPPARWLKRVGLALGFGVTTIASALAGTYIALTVPLPDRVAPQETVQTPSLPDLLRKGVRHTITRPVNILVMGIDRVPGAEEGSDAIFSGRSDTLLLIQVNPATESVSMLSIPRDTQVRFPGYGGVTKINHANAIGGPRLAADVVSYNLGDVEIDRYVRFSTDAFRQLVDLVGGVEVFVPQRMRYTDRTQGLDIDLEQGLQVLNGDEAEQFARFRSDAHGDIGRVQRQQLLIRALRDRLTSPAVIPRIPQIIDLLKTNIDTNLTSEELMALATFGLDLDQDALQMVMLPGTFSRQDDYLASYWIMDDTGVNRVLNDYFGVSAVTYTSDVSRLDEQDSRGMGRSLRDLRIAVQNASDHPRLASQVAQYLQEQGLRNVYVVRDWPAQQQHTQIIVQNGYLQGATTLEQMLGIGQVLPASTGDLGSDLTIRVGDDWLQRPELEL